MKTLLNNKIPRTDNEGLPEARGQMGVTKGKDVSKPRLLSDNCAQDGNETLWSGEVNGTEKLEP